MERGWSMSNRLPIIKDILPVFAALVFMIQTWTLLVLFQQLPAWLNYLAVGDIFGIFAYRIAASFLECLLVLGCLLAVSMILPARFFRDVFVVRGTAFSFCFLGSIILFWRYFEKDPGVLMADYVRTWTALTFSIAIFLSYRSTKMQALADFLEWISDRLIIFLYVSLPLSLASFVIILLRNIQ